MMYLIDRDDGSLLGKTRGEHVQPFRMHVRFLVPERVESNRKHGMSVGPCG